jgi:enoyl-[acyl-carrier protein] reductase III
MTNLTLKGKCALITGGSRGIGRAIAKKLASEGADIVINYFNSGDEAELLCAELTSMGVLAHTVQGSVADPESVKLMINTCKNHFGKLDILVNNAASGVLKPALEMTLKHWRWCLETNAFSLNLLAQTAKEIMPPGSRMLALTSMGSHRAIPNYAFIGASKAALESLVRSLSLELAPLGISVNTISAGAVDTDALKYFPNYEQLLKKSQQMSLTGKNITPEDVANVAYLLCLPEAEMIKGQMIIVDAGYSIIG